MWLFIIIWRSAMKSKTLASLLVAVAVITLFTQPALTDVPIVTNYDGDEANRPLCPAPGRFSPTTEPFEEEYAAITSVFLPQTGDSLPLFVVSGELGVRNFKFVAYSPNFDDPIEQECSSTNMGDQLVGVVGEFMFLVNGVNYKACRFDPFSL